MNARLVWHHRVLATFSLSYPSPVSSESIVLMDATFNQKVYTLLGFVLAVFFFFFTDLKGRSLKIISPESPSGSKLISTNGWKECLHS
jgi:hypothetical protein